MGDGAISTLERAIVATVRYGEILSLPLTAVQTWRSLIVRTSGGAGMRWGGESVPTLPEVQAALAESAYLRAHLSTQWGYYMLRRGDHAKKQYVRERLNRHLLAQHKWKITRRAARWLSAVPFVRVLAGSGSLAVFNTRPGSDLDLFAIVRARRIWTARLLLLAATQLLGRRRKHWNREAPDKICLNHYITDDALMMPMSVRNIYTATQYTQLVPLVGHRLFWRWQRANDSWVRSWLMHPPAIPLRGRLAVQGRRGLRVVQKAVEAVLLEPVGDVVERWAEKWQRRVIRRHSQPGRGGRVYVSATELAFHPDSKVPAIIREFGQEPGQVGLWQSDLTA